MRIEKPIEDRDIVQLVTKDVTSSKVLLSSKMMHRGQKVFEFSLVDGSIREAERESIDAALTPDTGIPRNKVVVSHQIIHKLGCMYFIALNKKNVIKQVKKFFAQKEAETVAQQN